ncbi:hypothetical protein Asera_27980 [Actinocatenispora sera]|jgi:hypothetical protein|uniref:Uncharacterized protein n=1 Tax=Actinocatenispora sera TaxID=390989 RepID=A0A810KZL6_9ACTN|nr:hypothetical protein Asera_27980 [Actinocatenispora sera]
MVDDFETARMGITGAANTTRRAAGRLDLRGLRLADPEPCKQIRLAIVGNGSVVGTSVWSRRSDGPGGAAAARCHDRTVS